MIFHHVRPIVDTAEWIAATADVDQVLRQLRQLCFVDFGTLLLEMPHPDLPNLSRVLPRTPSVDVQKAWTGTHGFDLFRVTKDFTLRLQHHFETLCGRPLHGARILDYGVGYGRLARAMLYFTDPRNLYGLDPWDAAIDLCRKDNVLGNFALSDYLPARLPLESRQFDLIYSYSVFTHTSPRAARAALTALRDHVQPNGLLVITVRPLEFWNDAPYQIERPEYDRLRLTREYTETGYAHLPNNFRIVDGDHVYGDATIAPEWIVANCPQWNLRGYDRGEDLSQTLFLMTPA